MKARQSLHAHLGWIFMIALILLTWSPGPAWASDRGVYVPPDLEQWKDWVLHDREQRHCPFTFGDGNAVWCAWPSRLELKLDGQGGEFSQEWMVYAESWAYLPGGPGLWPENVRIGGDRAVVVDLGKEPAVRLSPGLHRIEGSFSWTEMPETIRIPATTGLVQLTLNDRRVDYPVMDENGRLWLQKKTRVKGEADRLDIRVFRLITDSIPMETLDVLKIKVSGRSREVTLNNVLLAGATPMNLGSPLPSRLGADGVLKLQVRPGSWEIKIISRFDGPVDKIGPAPCPFGSEIWAFKPMNHLRLVEIEGAPAVDPSRTDIPSSWRNYSTYAIEPETVMVFKTKRRGDPDPAPDRLDLQRTWWLDFDGKGFTINDRITGSINRRWSLAMNPPTDLGRVAVDGHDRLITMQEDGKSGVELRRGKLQLNADSRYDSSIHKIPAVGWDHDFQSVSGVLKIPPGWRLIAASGVDVLPGAWIRKWTLLDFFIVLMIALAIFKLAGWQWGILALVTLPLIYHEPGSPKLVWLNLMAATALLKVLPEGWVKKGAGLWRLLSIVTLLVLAIPFMVQQARVGLYPQLERYYETRYHLSANLDYGAASAPQEMDDGVAEKYAPRKQVQKDREESSYGRDWTKGKEGKKAALLAQDPKALIQTGPGLPDWNWRSISMKWNGPVDSGQEIRLWLLSPTINMILSFLRIVLLAALIVGLINLKRLWRNIEKKSGAATAILLVAAFLMPGVARAADVQQPSLRKNQQVQVRRPHVQQTRQEPAIQLPVQQMAQRQVQQQIRQQNLNNQQDLQQQNAINQPLLPSNKQESKKNGGPWAVYPPAEILDELQRRLLEKPDCLPYCAHFSRMELGATPEALTMKLEVHALERTAVPVPGSLQSWRPSTVRMDEKPPEALLRDRDGTLWVLAPQGVHVLTLSGPTPQNHSFQVEFPLRPSKAVVEAEGWDVTGLNPDGRIESSLQFTRLKEESAREETLGHSILPPYFQVERTLSLGLTWEVHTQVRRLSRIGTPTAVAVPLLEGESVTTAGIQVVDGRVRVHMSPQTREVTWTSSLDITPEIRLKAPKGVPWSETWILDSGPIWHCELAGLTVIHHQDEGGHWRPTWRPWPGEEVIISVSKPKALAGQIVTIDRAELELTPGRRFHKAGLTLGIRASQGGRHRVSLPEGARLQQVKINDRTQPIGSEKNEVVLPLQPGAQMIYLEWHSSADSSVLIKGPKVGIGEQAVNAKVVFNMPRDRWILLTGGPKLGPAVLFWTYLVVVILAALVLGRMGWTPLKMRHWLLLSLGLTQVHPLLAIVIVGWLLILDYRLRHARKEGWFWFDLGQIGLAVWTIVALIGLYTAVEKGLLGIPLMQIAGNSSTDFYLHWTQDRIGSFMPQPWVLSLPRLVYHILMLVWALWMALSLLKWLRWGWEAYTTGDLWRNPPRKPKKIKKEEDNFVIE